MQRPHAQDILKVFSPKRIIWPVLIGLGVASFLLFRNFDAKAFGNIHWTWNSTFWIFISFLMVVIRDLAYMYRVRVLTDNDLGWKQSFQVIMLWEFASAVNFSALGGGFAFAIAIISMEKIKLGRSMSVVMFTSFLDGLFFAIMGPIVYFTVGKEYLFGPLNAASLQKISYGQGLYVTFWLIYFGMLVYKLIVGYALFINSRTIKTLLFRLFSLRLLRRWRAKAIETGEEMEIASKELQGRNLDYWLKSFGATFVSWTARYIIVNCIVKAFTLEDISHYILYARQVVMGLLVLVSPSPGGSGFAEFMFSNFLGEFIPNGLSASLALLWRLISYYPYIFVGVLVLPRWLSRVFKV